MPAVPPRPASYSPTGLPPGDQFELHLFPFWRDRPMIKPRLIVVHTNAANNESDLQSQFDWGMSDPQKRTAPTWQVERSGRAWRNLPSDRRSIANATVDSAQGSHGDVATWSLSIETCDAGWGPGKPGENNVFTPEQGESVARIMAYEAWGWGFPAQVPDVWYAPGGGMVTHTWPFPYPYYTLMRGKSCPGEGKKRNFREWLLPRAQEILAAWSGITRPTEPPPTIPIPIGDDDVVVLVQGKGTKWTYVSNFVQKAWLRTPTDTDACRFVLAKRGGSAEIELVEQHQLGGFGPIVGDKPPGVNDYGEAVG